MRRLVLLGLLGLGVTACEEEPIGPMCPDLIKNIPAPVPAEQRTFSAPPPALSTRAAALQSDGRQPVMVRFRKPSSRLGAVSSAALSSQREDKVERLGARVKYNWPELDTLALSLSPEEQARLAKDPEVLAIYPDRPVRALGRSALAPVSALLGLSPNPSGSTSEYTWAVQAVQAHKVWDANEDGMLDTGAPTGEGIKVCVIDSGIDPDHPELKLVYGGGKDLVDDDELPFDKDANGKWGGGHGTHVAGTIVAQLGLAGRVNPNDKNVSAGGMVGVSPGATLLVARVLDENGDGTTSDVIEAMKWCQGQGAKIASLSLGSDKDNALEKEAFANAWAAGMLSIAASGNNGESAPPESKIYPAAYENVIAVGAVNAKGEHANFSQGGSHLSLVAPGVGIYSTYIQGRAPYAELQVGGTFYTSSVFDYVPYEEYEGKLIDCGLGTGLRSCPGATCGGFVAYVDRGDIKFSEKVYNVRSQGAYAVIVGNNKPEDDDKLAFTLGEEGAWPPVTAVPTTSVASIRQQVGSSVRVGIKGSDYALSSGTSMATPHVSAVAALVWSARPDLTNAQVRDVLEKSAKDLVIAGDETTVGRDIYFGHGMVQAKAAVDRALALPKSTP
jgi:subtilisin family serine protease